MYSLKLMIVDWIRNISKLLLETTVLESLFSQETAVPHGWGDKTRKLGIQLVRSNYHRNKLTKLKFSAVVLFRLL